MIRAIVITTLLLVVSAWAHADTIHFSNGATVTGKIVSRNSETVTIESNGRTATYSMKDIATIQPDYPVASPPPAEPAPAPATESTPTDYYRTGPRLIGPAGATGVIRRHERREGRRGATIQ